MCGSGRLIFVLFFSGAALVALILRLLAVLDTFNLVCIGVMLLFACATTISHVFAAPPSRDRFDAALDAWIRAKGPIEKLIVEPRLSVAPPDYPEKDIYDYGVQRLLIVQHDLLVDLFVLNNFHAEEQTLVMSAGGYPAYVARRAAEILRGSRDLTVYLLHDATDEGMRMSVAQLPSLDQHQVIELGLFPDDVRLLRALRPIRPARRGYRVPVDSIPYKRLAALLTAAITARTPLAEVLRARVAGNGDTIGGAGFG
jgi:hypothetical protein